MNSNKTDQNCRLSSLLGTAIRTCTAYVPAACIALLANAASAADLYWDTNGSTPGAGNTSADWDTGFSWSTSADGDIPQVAWTDGENAVFSAGTDGANFTATVTTSVTTPAIVIEEAGNTVTLAGGTINIGGGSIDSSALGAGGNQNVAISAELAGAGGLSIAAHGDLSASGGGSNSEIDLTGTNTFSGGLIISSGLVGWDGDAAFGDAGNSITLDGGGLVDTNRGLTLGRDLVVGAGGGTYRVYGSANSTLTGDLQGAGTLSKTDGGGFTIASNTSFTGTLDSLAGTVRIGDGGSIANAAALNLNGGSLWVRRTDTASTSTFLPSTITFASAGSTVEFNPPSAAADLTLDQDLGSDPALGTLRVSGGQLTLASGTDVVVSQVSLGLQDNSNRGTIEIGAGATLTTRYMNLGANGSNSGTIEQTGGVVTVVAGGDGFRLGHWSNGANDGNDYNLTGGVLDATATAGSGGWVNIGWDGQADMVVGGGAGNATVRSNGIRLDRSRTDAANKLDSLTISANGVVEVGSLGISGPGNDRIYGNGGSLLATAGSFWNATIDAQAATTTSIDIDGYGVTLQRMPVGDGTLQILDTFGGGVLELDSGSGSTVLNTPLSGDADLAKVSSGTLEIASSNINIGQFFLQEGTLNLTGSLAGDLLSNDSTLLTGGGAVGGNLVLGSGGGGQLLVNPADALDVAGDVSFVGSTTISLTEAPSGVDPVIPIVNYGTLTGDPATGLSFPGAGDYRSAVISDDAANSRVILTLDNEDLTWTGTTDGTWDLSSTSNWVNGGANTFFAGDLVTFDDTGANPAVTLVGDLSPGQILVDADTNNYSFTGSAGNSITGLTSLVKDGSSTLNINAPNSYTGGTVISEGIVEIQTADSLGAGQVVLGDANTGTADVGLYFDTNRVSFGNTVVVSNNGTGTVTLGSRDTIGGAADNNQFLDIVLERDVTFDSNAADRTDYENISGTGDITVIGTGRSIFPTNGASWTGDVVVAATGGLQIGVASTAGNRIPDDSDLTVSSGGLVRFSTTAETIGGLNGSGTVNTNAPSGGTGTVTLGTGDADGSFTGLLENGAGTLAITKVGDGTQSISGVNTHTGRTTVSGGVLEIDGEEALGADPAAAVADQLLLDGGTLRATGSFAIDDANRGVTTAVPGGAIEVAGGETVHLAVPVVATGGLTKLGDGALTATNLSGALTVASGSVVSTGFSGTLDYTVEPTGTLTIDYGTGATYGLGVTVEGDGVASPAGFYLAAGRNINFQRSGGLRVTTAPTTLRASGAGTASVRGFDINGTNLTIESEASGTVIDSSLQIRTQGFGYRMNVAAGTDNATGDLIINSDMPADGGSVGRGGIQVNLQKWGDGSVLLNGNATFPEGLFVRQGAVILGADERIADSAGVILGDGGVTGTLVLNGFSETISDLGNHNGNVDGTVLGGSPLESTLTVIYDGAGRTFTGTIGGAGDDGNLALVKSGLGTFALDGTLAYTGDTTVDAGTLSLAVTGLDDTSTVNIDGTGVLDLAHGASDTVEALLFDGVPQAIGTWGATGSGAANIDDARFSGSGVLNVTTMPAVNPYSAYETANNIGGAGADVDSDGDGVDNGIEFVIGGVSDPGIGQSDLDKLPTASFVSADPDLANGFEDYLLFTYRRTDESAASSPYAEYSTTLGGWTEAADGVDGVVILETNDGFDTGVDQVDVYIPASLAIDGKLFGRLRVDIP